MQEKIRAWSHHQQCLGHRAGDVMTALKACIGVYSSHPSGPLSLWARVRDFSEQAFFRLDLDKFALRLPAMRQSAYMMPWDTAFRIKSAVLPGPDDPAWARRYTQKGRYIEPELYDTWKQQVLDLAQEPIPAKAFREGTEIPHDVLKMVLNRIAFEGGLLRIGALNLRSNIISYVSTQAWTGKEGGVEDEEQSLAWLAGEYLRAFGPARIKDFQWWTGVTLGRARVAIDSLDTVEVAEGYLLLNQDREGFEKFQPTEKDQLDLLPQWDAYTMGYAPDGRQRLVSPDFQGELYGNLGATGGNALGAIMVNGLVHGSWKSRFKATTLELDLNMFSRPSDMLQQDILNKFQEMAGVMKAKKIKIN